MERFKYLGTTQTNQNFIYKETESRLKSGNACYHSVRNLVSFSLLSRSIKIKIHRTVILSVLYGCETWSLSLREGVWEEGAEENVLCAIAVCALEE